VAGDRNLALAHGLAFGLPAVMLGGAYYFQYVVGLFPCEMCWYQRYPHFAALALAALAFLIRSQRRTLVALAGLAILVSGGIGGFHAGVEYGWWEGFTTCSSAVPESDDPLAAIMNAPIIRCDVAPWELWGVSLAGWNFLFSTAGALALFALLLRRKPA
jgi:disulfide bond formation protein DsbB